MIGEDSDRPVYIIAEKINGFVPRTGKAVEEGDAEYIKIGRASCRERV